MSDYTPPIDDEDLSIHLDNLEEDISNDWDNLGAGSQDTTTKPEDDASENTETTESKDTNEEKSNELELTLVAETDEKYNEGLVQTVERLLQTDYFAIDDAKIVELFDGTEAGWNKILIANQEAIQEQALQAVWNSIPAKGKEFFQYLSKSGDTARIQDWLELEKIQESYDAINVEALTDEQAKDIIIRSEKEKGVKPRYIEAIITSLEDDNELIKTAKEIVTEQKVIIAKAKEEQIKADAEAKVTKQKADEAKFNNTVTAIQNTKYAETKQKEIYDTIYTVDTTTGMSKIVSYINHVFNKPEHLVQLVTLFDGFDPEKGFDLKRLKAQVKSEIVQDVKKTIVRNTNVNKTTGGLSGDASRSGKNWQPSNEELGLQL